MQEWVGLGVFIISWGFSMEGFERCLGKNPVEEAGAEFGKQANISGLHGGAVDDR